MVKTDVVEWDSLQWSCSSLTARYKVRTKEAPRMGRIQHILTGNDNTEIHPACIHIPRRAISAIALKYLMKDI